MLQHLHTLLRCRQPPALSVPAHQPGGPELHAVHTPIAMQQQRHSCLQGNAHQETSSGVICRQQDHLQRVCNETSQPDSTSSRRALLLAIGLAPTCITASTSAAGVGASDETSSSSNGLPAGAASTAADGNAASTAGGSEEQQQGDNAAAASSQEAQQVERDDSPSQLLEDEEDSSSSSSSDDDDSDSDSSSDDDDDEPGELVANSDDNNAASDGSTSSTSSSSSSSSSSGPDTATNADASSSGTGTGTESSSGTGTGSSTSSTSKSSNGRTAMSANLSVPSYIQILQDSRRASWPLVAQKIQAGEWIELSQLLVQPPFDAVRQACFYIPWALLQSDDFNAAVAARKAYVDYIDHVHALAAIALKAADGVPGADVQVQQAFTLLNASLNAFLSAVPVTYHRHRV